MNLAYNIDQIHKKFNESKNQIFFYIKDGRQCYFLSEDLFLT
jgi:hypothetical protein